MDNLNNIENLYNIGSYRVDLKTLLYNCEKCLN